MPVLRGFQSVALLAVVAIALLLAPFGLVGHGSATDPANVPPVFSGCSGASLSPVYSGSLEIEGGPLAAAAVSNVSLAYGFSAEVTWMNLSTGAVEAQYCETVHDTATTSGNGAFTLSLGLPSPGCDRLLGACSTSSGPFGPLTLAPTQAAPTGYLVSVATHGSTATVAYVADLAGLALVPTGPVAYYSPGASEAISAQALAGNGSLSPVRPEYSWSLSGLGWSLGSSSRGSTVNLTAAVGAGLTELSVVATWVEGGTTETAGPVDLGLEAVATSISTALENRSEVDAGRPVTFTLSAVGAPGYVYNASVLPGLGLASVPLGCTLEPPVPGSSSVFCSASVVYPAVGVASPEVEVSNGYSVASASLAPVTVRAPPLIEVTPTVVDGYAGDPVTLQVEALPSAGSGPYVEACFDPGPGPTVCSSGGGPSWSLSATYATPGTYAGSAWAVDGDGGVAAVPVPVTIVVPLSLGPPSSASPTAPVGTPVQLSLNVTGGIWPGEFWWNVSGANGSLAHGPVVRDGPLSATWVPSVVGSGYLSLTVVDGLGTESERTVHITVVPDPAAVVSDVVLPPATPIDAGTPVAVAWQAFDAHGARAVTFAPGVAVHLAGAFGSRALDAWVNVSGVGSLAGTGAGVFGVPSTAWSFGRLNLTVSSATAGPLEISLVGNGLPESVSPLTLTVLPDLHHLVLFDPEVAEAGARSNATFWHVRDPFGNPAVGASIEVEVESGGTSLASIGTATGGADAPVGIWVNYSMPGPSGGWIEVRSGSQVLLGPLAIPAAPATTSSVPAIEAVAALGAAGGLGLGAVLWVRRRRGRPSGEESALPESALREFVMGRDRVIETVREAGAADLTRIERAWQPAPPPAELSDWVASLVADGTLGARTGPDGVARFCLAGPPSGPAHVILDERALERALRAREELDLDGDARVPRV